MKIETKKILKKVFPEVATSSSRDSIDFFAIGHRKSTQTLSDPLHASGKLPDLRKGVINKQSHSEKGGRISGEVTARPPLSDDSAEKHQSKFAVSAPMRHDSNIS